MYVPQKVSFATPPPVGFPKWPDFRLQYSRWSGVRKGVSGFGCISVTDLTSKCGGYTNNCDPRDTSCVANATAINSWAQDQMYAYGFPNTCIPDDLPCPNLSSAQQAQVAAAFMNNTPIDLATGTQVSPDAPPGTGIVPGVNAPAFLGAQPSTPAKTTNTQTPPPPASSTVSSSGTTTAPGATQAAPAPTSSWLTSSMFGGVPNWAIAGAGALALILVVKH